MARFASGCLIALGAAIALGAVSVSKAGDVPAPVGQHDAVSAPAGAQGMIIYRDPATGQLGVPPPGVVPPPAPVAAPRGVAERPGTTPAGGVLLDAVPWNTMTVTTDAAGHASGHCDRRVVEPGE